ncbi:MAG: histidine kinase [Aureispira sp.]
MNWSWAQQSTIDSLQALLPMPKTATHQANLYYQLAAASLKSNPLEAIIYSNQAQELIGEKEVELKGKIYQVRGTATQYLGQLQEAEQQLDSAFKFLSTSNSSLATINKSRYKLYHLLMVDFLYKNPQKSVAYANKLLPLITTNNYAQFSTIYNIKASAYGILMHYDSALVLLECSLQNIQKLEDSPSKQSKIAAIYNKMAGVYVYQQHYQKAAQLFYQAIDIYEAINAPTCKANALTNLSAIYAYLEEAPTTIPSVRRSTGLLKETKDTFELYQTYYDLSLYYSNKEVWDTALVMIDSIIPFYSTKEHWEQLAYCYIQKSYCYNKKNNTKKALLYSEKAEQLSSFFHATEPLYKLQLTQADLYRKIGALERSKQLYRFLIDSSTISSNRIQALAGAIETAVLLKDFELAYDYTQQKTLLKDSLATIHETNAIRDLEIKYETKEVSQQNEALKQQQAFQEKEAIQSKKLLYLTIGMSILFLTLFFLFFQYKAIKNNYQTRELKYQLLQNQMNPHFLFNVLGAIQSFIYTNNPIKAGDFLSSFALLVRSILDNSTQEYIPISKEIEWLENYVSLQALRFGEHLDYTIDIDPALQNQAFLIPPMLIQPIIENSLEHGFKNIDYQGYLNIKMTLVEKTINILIKDNGVGYDPTKTGQGKEHISHATRITKERIDWLNKKNTKNITFETLSAPQKGTIVNFHLPLDY